MEEIQENLGAISTLGVALSNEIGAVIEDGSVGIYSRLLSPSEWGHSSNGSAETLGYITRDLRVTIGGNTAEFGRNHRLAIWNAAKLRNEPHFTLDDARDVGFAPGQTTAQARASMRMALSRTNQELGFQVVHSEVVRRKARYHVDEGLTIIEARPEFIDLPNE